MKKTLFALALAAALPLSAQAAEPTTGLSYTWLEGDYIDVEGGNGWGLRGSFDFGASGLYGFGSWSKLDADENDFDIDIDNDLDANEFGVGYHHPVADNTDLIAEAAYRNYDADAYRIDGARFSVGARAAMTDNVEGFVKANYYDMSDYDGDFTGTIGAQYKFTDMWGVTGEAEFGNGDKAWMLGMRASFGSLYHPSRKIPGVFRSRGFRFLGVAEAGGRAVPFRRTFSARDGAEELHGRT